MHGDTVVADTTFIIKYLTATYAKELTHSHLQLPDPEQQALAVACMAVIEEKLLYDLAYHRFVAESVSQLTQESTMFHCRHSQFCENLAACSHLYAIHTAGTPC